MNLFGDQEVIYDDEPADDFVATPASDKLSEPRHMDFCHGHDVQENMFLDLIKNGSLPHAMIFSGSKGIGKATMAFRLARFLLKHAKVDDNQDSLFGAPEPVEHNSLDVPASDPVFARVASGGHADLLYIERFYDSTKNKLDANLKVEAIRKIEPFLRKTASEGGWRIVIVDDADTMNRNAQNAILKILEEPPANVLIILIAHRSGVLIPTIHSRARIINFTPLSPDIMSELLHKQGYDLSLSDMETLNALSDGSIGQALRFAEEGGLESLAQILEHLSTAPNWDMAAIHKFANSLHAKSQDKQYHMFTELMQWIFRTLLFAKARASNELPQALRIDALQDMLNNYSLERLISISDDLKKHFDRVEFSNLDRRDAVRGSFLVISQ